MSYHVHNGRWCHTDNEPLDDFDKYNLSKQIDSFKVVAALITPDIFLAVFKLITHHSKTVELVTKIFNQTDSDNAILLKKL